MQLIIYYLVDQNSDGHHRIVDVLKSSKLERITDSLLSTINVKPSEKILNDLQSIANIHLSSLFTIQTDISPLSTPLSFYSHSFYSSQSLPANNSFKSSSVLQTTVCTVHQSHLHHTRLIFDLFYAAINEGLDITGLRLVHCNNRLNSFSSSAFLTSEEQHVVLAIAFRGPNAITSMVDIVGPEDHSIARVTDPESLSARYGQSKQVAELPPIVGTVHNEYWAGMELARWFGGRACLKTGSVLGISDPITKFERRKRQRVRFSESESEGAIPPLPDDIAYPPLICNRPVLLVYPYSKILLVASPHVNPFCYTSLLRSVARMGYDIMGIKRLRLNTKRGLSLNISASDILHFTPSSAPLSPVLGAKVEPPNPSQSSFPPLPSLLLVLGRENAPLYTTALTNAICDGLRQLSMQHQDALDTSLIDSPNALIHIVEYSEDCLKNIGSFTFTPTNTNGTKPSKVLMEEEGFKEEISFMAVIGHQSLEKSLNTLDVIVKTPSSQGESETGCFELLGIKLVDELSRYQAKQLCGCTSHYSQGSPAFTGMVDSLCDKPAMLFVLRGINCNHSISKLMSESSSHQRVVLSEFQFDLKSNNVLCSADLDKSFHLTSLFFIDKELFSHPSQWSFSIHAPSTWLNDCSILSSLTSDPIPLLSIFSVDMSHMGLLVKILQKLYHVGFKVVGMRLIEHEIESEDLEDSPQVNDNECAVVVCVERYNAVWYLIHELKLFSSNSPSYAKALYYSPSFISAVNDVQHYFPLGVHSSSTALLKYYQIQPAPNDSFGSRVESPVPSHLSPPPSPLSEDAYVIIPPSHLMSLSSSIPSYVTALDVLSKSGFSIIDILMIELSKETAQDICQAIDTTTTEFTELTRGPSLVVGIRRDNAASCFHSIITSSFLHCGIRDDPAAISKLFQNVLVTSSSQQTAVVRKIVKFEDCSNWF
jgi:nucleoside diphosphate kinase